MKSAPIVAAPGVRRPVPLMRWLRRGHTRVATFAIVLVGVLMALGSIFVLRQELARNLELVAQTTADAIEPAVAFHDIEAARQQLQTAVQRFRLASAKVELPDGRVLVTAQGPVVRVMGSPLRAAMQAVAGASVVLHAEHSVVSPAGGQLGRLMVASDGHEFIDLFGWHLAGVLAAMAATAVAVSVLARRMQRELAGEMAALASLTHQARTERAFDRRVPTGSSVAEIASLGGDINALLAEMHAHERELLARQERLASDNRSLQDAADRDGLTGVASRGAFERELLRLFDSAPHRARGFGLLFVDADRFKAVNDTYGHAVGDRVLIEIARRLQDSLRADDVVGRIGGDEFAVVLPSVRARTGVAELVRKIEAAMRQPLALDGGLMLEPAVSVGVAMFPEDGLTMQALVAHADRGMYERKRARYGEHTDAARPGGSPGGLETVR